MNQPMPDVSLSFAGQQFRPLPCGALFWPAQSLLLVADLHLEKGSSLARDGWLLPPYDSIDTLDRLHDAVRLMAPHRLVLLGDSFHDRQGVFRLPADARARLDTIAEATSITWIAGNHDGLSAGVLPGTVAEHDLVAGIALVHESTPYASTPAIAGHYHPKVAVPLGHGRIARRRCLALGPLAMILPAYGAYAGGLDIGDPAITAACGGPATAIVATPAGIVRVPSSARLHQRTVA